MLKKMFDFSNQRSWKNAIGFYFFFIVVYAVILILFSVTFIIGLALFIKLTGSEVKQYDKLMSDFVFFANNILYATICIGFCLLFIFKKKLRCPLSIFLLLLSVPLTFIDGSTWGLIPSAILSTFPNKNISE